LKTTVPQQDFASLQLHNKVNLINK
jgi:hypothetical protein